eukprot:GILI01003436.1.p1 GENE.GILI01003436.1~~GILI01003436.1.p1  ORF type:complete len:347 (-),score=31.61 GILI01003436.1:96-1097(-)
MKLLLLVGIIFALGVPQIVAGGAGTRGFKDDCDAFNPCAEGLSCQPFMHECYHVPRRLEEPCMLGHECGPGLSCQPGEHVCYHSPRRFGEPCVAGHGCGPGLSCQPGKHTCYHDPRLEGEPCAAGHSCAELTKPYFNPKTNKRDGDWHLQCQAFTQTCRYFSPYCRSSRKGACDTCEHTAGLFCKALAIMPGLISSGVCGGLNLFEAIPGSERIPWSPEMASQASSLLSNALDIVNPASVVGQVTAVCAAQLIPLGLGICSAEPVCSATVGTASAIVCGAVGKAVGNLCALATKFVFEETDVKKFLVQNKCLDLICDDCVTDGCFDDPIWFFQ